MPLILLTNWLSFFGAREPTGGPETVQASTPSWLLLNRLPAQIETSPLKFYLQEPECAATPEALFSMVDLGWE